MERLTYTIEPYLPIPLPGEVHVWNAHLESAPINSEYVLSFDEKNRAERFFHERNRRSYTTRHGILRILLGRYLKIAPEIIRFGSDYNGKPVLTGDFADNGLFFNISHSEGLAIFTFSQERDTGVDIEYMGQITDIGKIADRFFSSGERMALRMSPESEKKETFFTIWTRKEALVKASGEGISDQLNEIDTSLIAGDSSSGNITYKNSTWFIRDLDIDNNYRAALASRGGNLSVTCFEWRNCFS